MTEPDRFGTRNLTLDEIDNEVNVWHESGAQSEPHLHKFLGLTLEEYGEWARDCRITPTVGVGSRFWFYDWDSLPARRTGEWWAEAKIVSGNSQNWVSNFGHRINKKTLQSTRRDARTWQDKFCWSQKQLEDAKWVARHGLPVCDLVRKVTDAHVLRLVANLIGYEDGESE